MVRTYTFSDQLAMSQGQCERINVTEILLDHIPGALEVHKASTGDDKKGTDWWVAHKSGKRLSIDAKIRTQDYAAHPDPVRRSDDLALETYSVCEKELPGWTRDASKTTDYILWVWLDTGRWCLVPFCMLCAVFQEYWEIWRAQYECAVQHTEEFDRDWHSECVYVPRRIVWAEIYKRFACGRHRVDKRRKLETKIESAETEKSKNESLQRITETMPLWPDV